MNFSLPVFSKLGIYVIQLIISLLVGFIMNIIIAKVPDTKVSTR